MAKLPLQYNVEGNKEGLGDFTPLPAGEYTMAITKTQYKETKAKTGHYLQTILKVISGKNKGRVLFENLNLDNPNPIAVEIANKTLNSICQACDKVGVEDSEELHGIPMRVTLKVVPATATQPASNSVTMYKPHDGSEVEDLPVETQASSSGTASQTTTKKKLPWEA